MKSLKKLGGSVLSAILPNFWKSYSELSYWKKKKSEEGELANDHYDFFYTTHFNLTKEDYKGKRILDVGCGPRGSLEWADMAEQRVGLDPLAKEYLKLGADQHRMEYVESGSENIPFPDGHFDIVCSFNSLDHVTNVEQTLAEIKRITAPKGLFLLLVEANHKPTSCEPHEIKPGIIKQFEPEFTCEDVTFYLPEPSGLYASVKANCRVKSPMDTKQEGWLSARFIKNG